ncbi:hypothetical protein NMY22_g12833 [Coprinellus aureogranulatus]|nr:hypothetical protein NMY22_g12833 [Coprinellus aureogranulatus]
MIVLEYTAKPPWHFGRAVDRRIGSLWIRYRLWSIPNREKWLPVVKAEQRLSFSHYLPLVQRLPQQSVRCPFDDFLDPI